jgi:hypothetical protein
MRVGMAFVLACLVPLGAQGLAVSQSGSNQQEDAQVQSQRLALNGDARHDETRDSTQDECDVKLKESKARADSLAKAVDKAVGHSRTAEAKVWGFGAAGMAIGFVTGLLIGIWMSDTSY